VTRATRETVRELLGLQAPSTYRPVRVVRAARPDLDGVRCEHVRLSTTDGDEIPCLLLTPRGPWRAAVVALHQHGGEFELGKAEVVGAAGDPALAYGRRLADAGAAVLVPDLLGFEERQRDWSPNPQRSEQLDALQRVAQGSSLQAKHTRDVAVATSWLHEQAGPSARLGVVGHSLGGQVAFFALAYDARLSAGVISCGVGTVASFVQERIEHNPAWFVPGLVRAGDTPAVAAAVRDQQVVVSAGTEDRLFPLAGVRDVVAALPPDVSAIFFDGGHELTDDVMARARHVLLQDRPEPGAP